MTKYIGVTGFGRVGKDTFVELSRNHLKEKYNINSIRMAFADDLKKDLAPLVADSFGLDIFGLTNEQKEIVRPLMVEYGAIARKLTKGRFWIDRLEKKIKKNNTESNFQVIFISDVRFQEFEGDEVDWVLSKGGSVIGVAKLMGKWPSNEPMKLPSSLDSEYNGKLFRRDPLNIFFHPPANEVESAAGTKIYKQYCSNIIIWPDVDNKLELLKPIIEDFWINNKHLIEETL